MARTPHCPRCHGTVADVLIEPAGSHNWQHGQSAMRIVKTRLREMLPDIEVFLDVDNLGSPLSDQEAIACMCVCTAKAPDFDVTRARQAAARTTRTPSCSKRGWISRPPSRTGPWRDEWRRSWTRSRSSSLAARTEARPRRTCIDSPEEKGEKLLKLA